MKRRTRGTRREREGGFALLLVFLMAAVVGITLYMEVPRVAFQVQRQKEQLLMERGQQYQIAIRRYMQRGLRQGMNQMTGPAWPGKIEDLESTNGRRFLRKRYIDPMTGKDEWRIIHINNGILIDSINNKQKKATEQASTAGVGIADFSSQGQMSGGQAAMNLALSRRRASDNGSPGGGANGDSGGDPNLQGNSGYPPGTPVQIPGQPTLVGGPLPGIPGAPVNSMYPNGGAPYPVAPGGNGVPPGFVQPGAPVNGQPASVQQMLSTLLTQPRPGGMPLPQNPGLGNTGFPGYDPGNPNGPGGTGGPGFPPGNPNGFSGPGSPGFPAGNGNSGNNPQVLPGMGNNTIGGGLAGIASSVDADSIMVCGDHSNYQEWEFIFDPNKWRAPADPRKTIIGTPVGNSPNSSPSNLGSMGPGGSQPSPFGGGLGGGRGGVPPTPGTAQGQNQPGGAQGNFGTVCGMEARPGIQ